MRTAVVGLGNPFHGDDAIGPLVARQVYQELERANGFVWLESRGSSFDLAERLAGYDRAVIVDALVEPQGQVGTVKRITLPALGLPALSLHTAGLETGLQLARVMGIKVPADVVVYGIVIRDAWAFGTELSKELVSNLSKIVESIVEAEAACARSVDCG
jgi:hydrogenase maturation protease